MQIWVGFFYHKKPEITKRKMMANSEWRTIFGGRCLALSRKFQRLIIASLIESVQKVPNHLSVLRTQSVVDDAIKAVHATGFNP